MKPLLLILAFFCSLLIVNDSNFIPRRSKWLFASLSMVPYYVYSSLFKCVGDDTYLLYITSHLRFGLLSEISRILDLPAFFSHFSILIVTSLLVSYSFKSIYLYRSPLIPFLFICYLYQFTFVTRISTAIALFLFGFSFLLNKYTYDIEAALSCVKFLRIRREFYSILFILPLTLIFILMAVQIHTASAIFIVLPLILLSTLLSFHRFFYLIFARSTKLIYFFGLIALCCFAFYSFEILSFALGNIKLYLGYLQEGNNFDSSIYNVNSIKFKLQAASEFFIAFFPLYRLVFIRIPFDTVFIRSVLTFAVTLNIFRLSLASVNYNIYGRLGDIVFCFIFVAFYSLFSLSSTLQLRPSSSFTSSFCASSILNKVIPTYYCFFLVLVLLYRAYSRSLFPCYS